MRKVRTPHRPQKTPLEIMEFFYALGRNYLLNLFKPQHIISTYKIPFLNINICFR